MLSEGYAGSLGTWMKATYRQCVHKKGWSNRMYRGGKPRKSSVADGTDTTDRPIYPSPKFVLEIYIIIIL